MAAITRFVEYTISSSGIAGTGRGAGCKGTRGYSIGTADPGDDITIGSTTNRLYFNLDGDGSPPAAYVTIYSGSALDPRFVAKDITEKIRALSSDERYANAICNWENVTVAGGATNCNRFVLRSGALGSSSSVTITSGTNTAHLVLGYGTKVETGGVSTPDGKAAYTYDGVVSLSGTYYGLFDEVYKIVISNDNNAIRGIGTPVKDGSNSYTGVMTTGGVFNYTSDISYVMSINTTNGTTMGAGTGNVPRMSWTSTGSVDDSTASTELLYSNYWYRVGTKGFMVKFSDAVFNTCSPAWTTQCYQPDYAQGTNATAPVGTAEYVWSSDRGDMSSASRGVTVSGGFTALGTRGIYIKFSGGVANLGAGDCYYVICKGVQPSSYNITSLNYGNVTVSTESSVKSVLFEIESGAAELSTVKFGLQSHGTFVHHDQGNNDTYFRFGTVGPGNAPVSSGIEWYPNITAADIDSDVPPSYLYATEDNLPVVAIADLSEAVGSYPLRGMTADPLWLNIRLGASETGANSTINYRCYFDYA